MAATETLLAHGWVESVKDGYAFVQTQRETGCGGCAATATCGTSVLQKMFVNPSLLKVSNHLNARPGDEVELALEGQDLLKQALMAYGLPLVGLFSGALLAMLFVDGGDLAAMLGAAVGLVVAWWMVKRFYHPTQPTLVSIVKHTTNV